MPSDFNRDTAMPNTLTLHRPADPEPRAHRPWWREPMMWLVVGGPLAVVIAGIVTAAIAISAPDPVLKPDATAATELRPAVQARNHAAAPLPAAQDAADKR
jgi:uncharacterized protein